MFVVIVIVTAIVIAIVTAIVTAVFSPLSFRPYRIEIMAFRFNFR